MLPLRMRMSAGLMERLGPILGALALFSAGVVFGAMAAGSLGDTYRQTLAAAVDNLFQMLAAGHRPARAAAALGRALTSHGQTLALFWVLGISVVGVLGVGLLIFLRGFAAGFASALLAAELGWRGTLYAAAAVLPQKLVEVPALVLAGATACHFGLRILQGRARYSTSTFYRELGQYTRWMLIAGALFLAAALVESFLTPWLMQWGSRL